MVPSHAYTYANLTAKLITVTEVTGMGLVRRIIVVDGREEVCIILKVVIILYSPLTTQNIL